MRCCSSLPCRRTVCAVAPGLVLIWKWNNTRKTLPSYDASSAKDVPQPLRWARGVEQNGIHATRGRRWQSTEIEANRAFDARLFFATDARRCATKASTITLPHFNEYKRRAIEHDEIDFAKTTMPVALNEREAARFEQRFGFALVALTGAGFGIKAQL